VAVGGDGTILTSPDGVTGRCGPRGRATTLNGVTYGNGLFVAVGDRRHHPHLPDGVTWTVRTSGTGNDLYGVTYGNGLFVAVGDSTILTSRTG
jgi:hypothetical protein